MGSTIQVGYKYNTSTRQVGSTIQGRLVVKQVWVLHFEEHDFVGGASIAGVAGAGVDGVAGAGVDGVAGAGVAGVAGKQSLELIEGHGEEAEIVLPLVGLVVVREDFAQGTDVACAAHVLRRCDLLEIGDAVVGCDTVDVVNLHARCPFANPCFVNENVTRDRAKMLHVHVIGMSAVFLAGTIRAISWFDHVRCSPRDGYETRLFGNALTALGTVELCRSLSGFGTSASFYFDAIVKK